MAEITYKEVVILISLLWVSTRIFWAIRKRGIDFKHEIRLILVYICFIVIARIVYFPLGLKDGHIGVLHFDIERMYPFRINSNPIEHMFDIYSGWLINIIGNVTMFIPVGIVWPYCFKKLDRVWKVTLAGFGLSLFIEITQLPFYERCSDIDDLIMNTSGALIGAIIFFVTRWIKRRSKDIKNDQQR